MIAGEVPDSSLRRAIYCPELKEAAGTGTKWLSEYRVFILKRNEKTFSPLSL